MPQVQFSSGVRGFHICKDRWMLVRDKILLYQREIRNAQDPFAIKVTKWKYCWAFAKKDKLNVFVISEEKVDAHM